MDFGKIKLIIWDLDETFWQGTISEENIIIPEENIKLVHDAADAGVIFSICSKNDLNQVERKLEEYQISDYFVFKSINWSPKGERVSQIISEMNLRTPNVLFIDDNSTNRSEVKASCPEIMVADIDVLADLYSYFSAATKKDPDHNRLKQYKVLEQKKAFKATVGSNTEFLEKCSICVNINSDCENHIERIEDLIARSNQLNFTKVRLSKEEIVKLINDKSCNTGYVKVHDNFGDYGIVGFYALKNNKLEHFVFSCRTLGMGIEQYVYKILGKPELDIVGEVSSSPCAPDPYWINATLISENNKKKDTESLKIVLKGLCDMQQMFAYIAENPNIITEFEYVNRKGVSIEQRNHSIHVMESQKLTKEQKHYYADSLPFGDDDMFNTSIFDKDINYVVFSLFTDPNMGLYKDKENGTIIAFGEYTNNITDKAIWPQLINKELFVANCNFTESNLEDFKNRFDFIGRISVNEIINNLDYIYKKIDKSAYLVLVLGSEKEYVGETKPAYMDRHIYNKKLNEAVKLWAMNKNRIRFININDIAKDSSDYTNNINHFTRKVYFTMSNLLINIIEETGGNKIKQNGELVANLIHLKRKATKAINLLISFLKR